MENTAGPWSEWLAALAWADLLTDWHLRDVPEAWQDRDEHTVRLVETLLGHAIACRARETPIIAEHPRDLSRLSLASVVLAAEPRSVSKLLVAGDPSVRPRAAELGADESRKLHKLVTGTSPRWDTVSQLGHVVGLWHLQAEDGRADATLGDRFVRRQKQMRDALDALYGHPF